MQGRGPVAIGIANYTLEVGTAFVLPAQSESIDILVNNYMFDLIPYADMDRILDKSRLSTLYEKLYRISPKAMGGCRGVQMADRLKRHAFIVELQEYHQQCLFPSEVIAAHKGAGGQAPE